MKSISKEKQRIAEDSIIKQSSRVGYSMVEFTTEYLADKLTKGDFYIPEYQREYVWEPDRASRFIESLILGIPIPFIFFWEDPKTGSLEIVDGSQRLRAIQKFFNDELILGDLDVIPEASGFTFSELMESRQRKLKNRSIRGIVLDEHADGEARADLFDRINTGSKAANGSEIRRGAIPGPFTELIKVLAADSKFIDLTPMSEMAINGRAREELVTRFFAFSQPLFKYNDRVSDYLFDYAERQTKEMLNSPSVRIEMTSNFNSMVTFVTKYFPYGFARSGNGKATPKTRFEAIAIGSHQAMRTDGSLDEYLTL